MVALHPRGRFTGMGGSTWAPWLPLLAAVGLIALVVFSPAERVARIDVSAAERFMESGPTRGLWQQESLQGTWDVVVVPHPDEAACVLIGRWRGDAEGTCGLWPAPRRRFAGHVVPGPADLFFRNFRRQTVTEEVYDQRLVLRATWVPKHDPGGETARIFWVDPRTSEVVRFEDRSIDDGLIRSLTLASRRVEDLGLDLEAGAGDEARMRRCLGQVKADEDRASPDLRALAEQVPFPLVRPLRVPAGFELNAARRLQFADDPSGGLAVLDYRDGMALIRILQGTREAVDAFEARERARDSRHHEDGTCPSIPEGGMPITTGGLRILRRKDRCRTVLRVDDIEGVSVTVIGRNELSQDAYLEVIESLDAVEPAP